MFNQTKIPGIEYFMQEADMPNSFLVLAGPAGAGKTMYCRQFLLDGMRNGDYGIWISSDLTDVQYRQMFSTLNTPAEDRLDIVQNSKFISPSQSSYSTPSGKPADELSLTFLELSNLINKIKRDENRSIRLVIDSLSHLLLLAGEKTVMKFAMDLSFLLKGTRVMAIATLTSSDSSNVNMRSIFDGILEMKLEEDTRKGTMKRAIRLHSIKGAHNDPSWVNFAINTDGSLAFAGESAAALTCTLCGKSIVGVPIRDSEFSFDSKVCMETYRKLTSIYGPSISEIGLTSELININFFFIDIVGLSDPSLSVRKQIERIEILNKLIGSCDAFAKTQKDKRIVLPTGDGMAMGFLLNPELSLQLAIQLHKKLHTYNRVKPETDALKVRIGLSSGPVFIVNDVNNNQNVWGPGIIQARRVMDIGDSWHILVEGTLAKELIELRDEYKKILKPLGEYPVKHGQLIKLYSAYSQEFGNPSLPARIINHN